MLCLPRPIWLVAMFVLALTFLPENGCGLERKRSPLSELQAERMGSGDPAEKQVPSQPSSAANPADLESSEPRMLLVRVGPTKRYFQLEDGTPFFPIGHNEWPGRISKDLCSPESIDVYFRNMREHGENVLRVIADTEKMPVENPPGTFNPAFKATMDHIVKTARKHGIYLQLAMWPNVWNVPLSGFWFNWSKHPYNKKNGGPVAEFQDLFRDPTAWKLQEGRIRFFVDTWGGDSNVFAWEIANEFNYVDNDSWINHMAKYCKEYELSRYDKAHLVCISTTASHIGTAKNAQWSSPFLDFACFHSYGKQDLPTGNRLGPVNPIQESLTIPKIVERVTGNAPGRPLLDSEMPGIVHGSRRLLIGRPAGDALFFEMFLTSGLSYVCSGAACPGLRWASNPVFQLEGSGNALSKEMYGYQLAIRRFVNEVDWNKIDPEPYDGVQVDSPGSKEKAHVISLAGKDRRYAVGLILHALGASKTTQFRITFSQLSNEPHRVRWFESRSGKELAAETADGNSFSLLSPPFSGHVLFFIEPPPGA